MNAERLDVNSLSDEINGHIVAAPDRPVPGLCAIRGEFSKRISRESPDYVLEVTYQLLSESETVPRFISYEIIHFHNATSSRKCLEKFSASRTSSPRL
jgi:hypothetical protein